MFLFFIYFHWAKLYHLVFVGRKGPSSELFTKCPISLMLRILHLILRLNLVSFSNIYWGMSALRASYVSPRNTNSEHSLDRRRYSRLTLEYENISSSTSIVKQSKKLLRDFTSYLTAGLAGFGYFRGILLSSSIAYRSICFLLSLSEVCFVTGGFFYWSLESSFKGAFFSSWSFLFCFWSSSLDRSFSIHYLAFLMKSSSDAGIPLLTIIWTSRSWTGGLSIDIDNEFNAIGAVPSLTVIVIFPSCMYLLWMLVMLRTSY